MASSSKNLRGTYIKALKEASMSILQAAESMNSRTSSQVRILQRENDRLRMERQLIKRELSDIRRDIVAEKEARETLSPSVPDSTPPT